MALIGKAYILGAVFNTLEKDIFSLDEISYTIMQIYFIAFVGKYDFRNNTVCGKKQK